MSRKRDPYDAWLDEYPDGNSDYGTYREQSSTSPWADHIARMAVIRSRRGQYLRRLRRLAMKTRFGR